METQNKQLLETEKITKIIESEQYKEFNEIKYCKLSNGETLSYRCLLKKQDSTGNANIQQTQYTILLIHGNLSSSQWYDTLGPFLSNKLNVIALDLRGFGNSSYIEKAENIDSFSDDMKLFIDSMELKSKMKQEIIVAGLSFGGMVVMNFNAKYPEYVHKLILIGSGGTAADQLKLLYQVNAEGQQVRLQNIDEIKQSPVLQMIEKAIVEKDINMMKFFFKTVFREGFIPVPPERYDIIMSSATQLRCIFEVINAMNKFNISSTNDGFIDGNNQVDKIECKTLIFVGDQDQICNLELQEKTQKQIGNNAQIKLILNSGHGYFLECYDTLKQITRNILEFVFEQNFNDEDLMKF